MNNKKYQSNNQQSLNPLNSISLNKVFLYGLLILVAVIIVAKFLEATKPPSAEMVVLREVESLYLPYKSSDREEIDRSGCETNWKHVTDCSRTIYNKYSDMSVIKKVSESLKQDGWVLVAKEREIYQKNINGYEICANFFNGRSSEEFYIGLSTGEDCR